MRNRTDEQLVTVARYIANNPVKARLSVYAEDWPWLRLASNIKGSDPFRS